MSITRPHPHPSAGTRSPGQATPAPLARFVRAASRRAARRPKLTIALWVALIGACTALGSLSGPRTLSDAASGVGESAHADARIAKAGLQSALIENVLVRSGSARQTAAATLRLSARARDLPSVRAVQTPRDTPALSRADGRTGLVLVTLRGDRAHADENLAPLQNLIAELQRSIPGVTLQEYGGSSLNRAMTQTVNHGLQHAELISIPITLVILVLAFGAVVAALVPLLLGITSVVAAMGALGPLSHIAPTGNSTAPVVVLIGLAVGVDYSLFYIRRERAERRAGAGPGGALDATAATVGRAILVAGMTVIIGLAGLLFSGFAVFTSMALGAILVVAIAVLGSLTVLPAVLALLGDGVDRGRVWRRRSGRRGPHSVTQPGSAGPTLWRRFGVAVAARPRSALALALLVLMGLAVPVVSMHTASPGDKDLSPRTPVIVAEHALDRWFPGASATGELVISGHRLATDQARARLLQLGVEGRRLTGGRGAISIRVARDGDTALVGIPVPGGSLTIAQHNVNQLRSRLEPATVRLIPGATAQLTGDEAGSVDFTNQLSTATPLVIAFVLALAFVLLVATFGSPLLAVSVMALNLLSVGAAFGVLVAVFEHRWAQSLLGFTSDGAVVNWLPLFAFVLLFGLSMDYTVLVLERAAEARRRGATAGAAAAEALAWTGSTVTSAAAVMVAVFAVFATLPLLEFKQLGIGLAAAIALDATVVRAVALPALLTLLGDRGLGPRAQRTRAGHGWDHHTHVATLEATHD